MRKFGTELLQLLGIVALFDPLRSATLQSGTNIFDSQKGTRGFGSPRDVLNHTKGTGGVGDVLHLHRSQRLHAVTQESLLTLHDLGRDALDRALALVHGLDEPLGGLDLAAQVLVDLGVVLGLLQQIAVDGLALLGKVNICESS